MRTPAPRRAVVALLAVAALLAMVAGTAPASAASPAGGAVAAGTTDGARWDVTAAADGAYVVRLTLPAAVPVRAALPQLAVDDVVLGTAVADRDGRTLRVRTGDAAVATARSVRLAWNGHVVGAPAAADPSAAAPDPAAAGPTGSLLADDPARAGRYPVQRADYDFGDTALLLPGLGNQASELRAAVYLPGGATGKRPVVVFLHGRHQACYGKGGAAATAAFAWPCPSGQQPVPSYLGYGEAAEALAAAGYVVVSISADAVNAQDYAVTDTGVQARGELVLDHLDRLREWNAGRGDARMVAALRGRLDLSDVGLMGHSRGGEGVVAAALQNERRAAPYGIRAVLPLAPTDFGRATLPGIPMAVMLPYCDGDVSDLQGQHFVDDTRYAADDRAPRTSLLVLGANHNYFNSEWTPGVSAAPSFDDWGNERDRTCGTSAPGRLSPAEQRAVGAAYISGFFRLQLGGESQFLPLFDGTGGRAASAGRATIHTEAQQPAATRTVLASLTGPATAVTTTGGATYCAGFGRAVPAGFAPCATSPLDPVYLPHWTPAYFAPDVPTAPMLHLAWADGEARPSVAVAAGPGSGARQAVTFRAVPAGDTAATVQVTAVDRAGRSATATVSVPPLPRTAVYGGRASSRVWLRTVRMPYGAFEGVDTSALASVRIAGVGRAGDLYLSDVALDRPAAGAPGPDRLPAVSISDAASSGAGRATFAVTLSAPSDVSVTVELDTDAQFNDSGVRPRWVTVTIPAGTTVAAVSVTAPTKGSGGPVPVSLSAPTNAVLGDPLGMLSVTTRPRG